MNVKKYYLLIGIVFLMGLLPQQNVSADMGPKPTMTFEFVQEIPGPTLTMISWSLVNCRNFDCRILNTDSPDIVPFMSNAFNCANNQCDAYIYYNTNKKYFQMEITFSDGKIRTSNVFTRKYFDAKYSVIIKSDSLYVEEFRGSNLEIISTIFIVVYELVVYEIPKPVLFGASILFMAIVLIYVKKFKDGKRLLVRHLASVFVFWPLIITLTIFGLILNAVTFLLTIFIEFVLMYAYLRYRKLPTWDIVRGVLLANVITQPLFVLALTIGSPFYMASVPGIALLEIIVCLMEAVVIYFVQKKELPFIHILALAFVLNAASFGIGLLLPI